MNLLGTPVKLSQLLNITEYGTEVTIREFFGSITVVKFKFTDELDPTKEDWSELLDYEVVSVSSTDNRELFVEIFKGFTS